MQQQDDVPKNRIGRMANEVYVGALVLGVVIVLAGVVAAIVAGVMQVSRWVALGN